MNTIVMQLYPEPFKDIVSGNKKIEYRLYDEKRKAIKIGDKIRFLNTDNQDKRIEVIVRGLMIYPDFYSMFNDLSETIFGPKREEIDEWVEAMHEIYSPKKEKAYGVLGILIEPLK